MARSVCTTLHRVARWNPIDKEFELQCPTCRSKSRQSYWPLTLEFWMPRSLIRCRACHLELGAANQRRRRESAAVRERDAAATAAWRARNPGYNVETSRLWREQNRERKRATDRARYARLRTAA